MRFPISCYDNFYEDPDYIRKFALSLDYSFTSGSFPGCRSDCLSTISEEYHYKSINKILSMFGDFDLSGVTWNANSHFQKTWGFSENPNSSLNVGFIHSDGKSVLAAVVYLDPDPIADSGTTIYKIKEGVSLKHDDMHPEYSDQRLTEIRKDVFQSSEFCDIDSGKHYKKCLINNNNHFEKTLEVKNSYNRIIMYDGGLMHGQSNIYTKGDNFRLTQVIFIYDLFAPIDIMPNVRCERYGI